MLKRSIRVELKEEELTGAALGCLLLGKILEDLRVLGVGRQVQQPCKIESKTGAKYTG